MQLSASEALDADDVIPEIGLVAATARMFISYPKVSAIVYFVGRTEATATR